MRSSITGWFKTRGWKPFKFQPEVWKAIAASPRFSSKKRPAAPAPSARAAIKTIASPLAHSPSADSPPCALAANTLRAQQPECVLSDHLPMEKEKAAARSASTGPLVQGRSVATLGQGMALVKIGKRHPVVVRVEDSTTVLLKKAAQALNKPGIDKSVVFRGPKAARIYAYSVDPQDPTKVVREAANGERTVGRLVGGSFRASSKA